MKIKELIAKLSNLPDKELHAIILMDNGNAFDIQNVSFAGNCSNGQFITEDELYRQKLDSKCLKCGANCRSCLQTELDVNAVSILLVE